MGRENGVVVCDERMMMMITTMGMANLDGQYAIACLAYHPTVLHILPGLWPLLTCLEALCCNIAVLSFCDTSAICGYSQITAHNHP